MKKLGAWRSSEVGNESHIDEMIIPGYMWYQTSWTEQLYIPSQNDFPELSCISCSLKKGAGLW